ncbi:hypothetical protein DPX16_7097 [Anabarilius grahami]|uniref:Myb/SANT-like DNA-binding domain-containing protein n=1 Tax=Anabarilius grahami TaxID=495550 RepID=A0A3N0XJG3_ANAGA|nr:hypothetical protein DPX16_7097 [Anabarilius grahami]
MGVPACFYHPPGGQVHHALLNLHHLKHPHTGESIARCIDQTLDAWGIGEDKVLLIVADNGSNIVKAVLLLRDKKREQSRESDGAVSQAKPRGVGDEQNELWMESEGSDKEDQDEEENEIGGVDKNKTKMEKQRRAFNFSAAEIEILISSIEKGKPVLFGKFSPSLTHEDQEREWAKVAENVSAVSGVSRSAESVKKKFTTLVSETKKKAAIQAKEVKKTGGGTSDAPSLTPSETRMLGVIDKVHYEGIPGGYEVGLEMELDQSELSTIQLSDLEEGTSVPLQLPPWESIARCIDQTLDAWGIGEDKVLLIVADNGSNIVKDVRLLRDKKREQSRESDGAVSQAQPRGVGDEQNELWMESEGSDKEDQDEEENEIGGVDTEPLKRAAQSFVQNLAAQCHPAASQYDGATARATQTPTGAPLAVLQKYRFAAVKNSHRT